MRRLDKTNREWSTVFALLLIFAAAATGAATSLRWG